MEFTVTQAPDVDRPRLLPHSGDLKAAAEMEAPGPLTPIQCKPDKPGSPHD